MKRMLVILTLVPVLLLFSMEKASGQAAVVVDPSQIAASATNAAEQVDYMLDQLSELAELGNKLNSMKENIDNVFGEDGVGGKTISVLQDLGTLTRLTESFNRTMKHTEEYAEIMKEMKRYRLTDTNTMLMYMNSMKRQAELAVEIAKRIMKTMGLSKKEKKDEIEKVIEDNEKRLKALDKQMEIEVESTVAAEGLVDLMERLDSERSSESFIKAKERYGNRRGAVSGTVNAFILLVGLLGIVACGWGYLVFVSGGLEGDPTHEQIFIRIGSAFIGATAVLSLLTNVFHLTL